MAKKNDGGPAFPRAMAVGGIYQSQPQEGMSLRDWFAGQAMIGILSWSPKAKEAAAHSYKVADAMLAARKDTLEDINDQLGLGKP